MKPQKGLGRGLDAIFGDSAVESRPIEKRHTPMSEAMEISVTRVFPNPTQPRTTFDTEALSELAESIRTLGIIQPITVKPSSDGRYMIISGERRWRAAKMAGLPVIPVYPRDVDDENLHAMALVENIQREDLNPLEVALGMKRLMDECDLTQETLSKKVGKKRGTVSNYLRLLGLPDEIQLALKEGLVSMGHVKTIAGASFDEQVKLLKKIIQKGLSVRQTEELVAPAQASTPGSDTTKSPEGDEYPDSYTRLVELLEKLFTQHIGIKRTKRGGGRITIDFDNDADIEQFIRKFEIS